MSLCYVLVHIVISFLFLCRSQIILYKLQLHYYCFYGTEYAKVLFFFHIISQILEVHKLGWANKTSDADLHYTYLLKRKTMHQKIKQNLVTCQGFPCPRYHARIFSAFFHEIIRNMLKGRYDYHCHLIDKDIKHTYMLGFFFIRNVLQI